MKGGVKMPRLVDRLTARRVASIVAARTPGMYPDGEGLYLQITPRGSASWVVVYRLKPKRRRMGLGPARLLSLAEARAKRDAAHKMPRFEGKDPLAHRAVRRARQSSVAARRLEHALLQGPEGRREFGERRAVAECARFALNDRQIVPPIEDGRRTLSLVRTSKDAAVFADNLSLTDDDNPLRIDPHADRRLAKDAGTL
jgi:hypothetical protein